MMKIFLFFSIILTITSTYPLASRAQSSQETIKPLQFLQDTSQSRTAERLAKGSHLKVFIPSLPYIYISHAINGALVKPANNHRGWDFDMAVSYKQIDDTTYEFKLRDGVLFQDGTPFNADAVVMNMEYFKKKPLLFTKIDKVFDHAEKVNNNTVRFYLKEKYGQFINDCIWIEFYTAAYLQKFGWNGKATCPNLAEAGPYGLGPYILKQGYIEGDRQTSKAELEANPYYWDKRYPKIERITVFTELDSQEALSKTLYQEGQIDLTPIPFTSKVQTLLSPYAKVLSSPSTNNWAIHLNLRNGNKRLLDKKVRVALNEAINQDNLLNFVYDGEGEVKPTLAAPLFPGVSEVVQHLRPYSEIHNPYEKAKHDELKAILNGLTLNVFTQDRFLFLWKGIEYQLAKVGVKLNIETTTSEKDIFGQLLSTNSGKNTRNWDLLIWGCDDWYYNHPWSAFLVYRTFNYWSTIFPDKTLDKHVNDLFATTVGTNEFNSVVEKIMMHVYDNGYMLFVPAPNNVLAVNKEVLYTPYKMAVLPLWEIQITKDHWSIRKGDYPKELKSPVQITRFNVDDTGAIVRPSN